MFIAVNIHDIICTWITVLSSVFDCNTPFHIRFKNPVQKFHQFLFWKWFQQISGSLYFITLYGIIRWGGKKNDRHLTLYLSQFSCSFHSIKFLHTNIQKKQIHSNVSFFHIGYKRLSWIIFYNWNLFIYFFKILTQYFF